MRMMSRGQRIGIAMATAGTVVSLIGCAGSGRHKMDNLRAVDVSLAGGDTTAAIQLLGAQTGTQSSPFEVYVLLGRLYRSRGSIIDRLRAQRVLEEGLHRFPDQPDLLVELGDTYYAQTLYGDAERVFDRILELDPDRCEAHYFLGINAYRKWKHVQSLTDYLTTSVSHLTSAVACDPSREDAFLKLAISRYVLGDTTGALETCAAYRDAHPVAPEPFFLTGCVAYYADDFEGCRDQFARALSLMGDDGKTPYTDISLLLSPDDDKRAYDTAPSEGKLETQRLYWIANDPDPTTEINERVLEHVCRVFMSDVRFASATPPLRGWETPRGTALIKFGEPDLVKTTLEGTRPTDGRTEIWGYLKTSNPFMLMFRDEYLNGNYGIPIDDEIGACTLRADPPLTTHIPNAATFPGVLDVAAFRESEVSSYLSVAFATDADTLDRNLWTWDIERFHTRTAVYHHDGRPYMYLADSIRTDSLDRDTTASRSGYVVVRGVSLPFDSYRVVFCLEDERRLTRSIGWADANTLRFFDSSLALSDVLLCSTPRVGGAATRREDKTLYVNPTGRYSPSEKLRVYVEVYNLGLRDARSNYEIAYTIRPADSTAGLWTSIQRGVEKALFMDRAPAPVISQTFQRTGTTDVAREEIAVGIDSLGPGGYVVTISVVDGVSGETAGVSKRFVKLGGNLNRKK